MDINPLNSDYTDKSNIYNDNYNNCYNNDDYHEQLDFIDNIGLYDESSFVIMNPYLDKFVENLHNEVKKNQLIHINSDNNFYFLVNNFNDFLRNYSEIDEVELSDIDLTEYLYESNSEEESEIEIELEIEENKKNILKDEDPWEASINDNKFYINNRIARVFPQMKNFANFGKIKIDDDSFKFITVREIAEIISKIISHHLLQFNINSQKSTIIDYTAGVGGNVLSFSKYFGQVYGIEISELRAEYLKNNVDVYGYKNIHVINESAIEFNTNKMIQINPSVIFIDPPWGGALYKNHDMLTLKLGEIEIENLILDIVERFSDYYRNLLSGITELHERQKITFNNTTNKLIVLKLPKNYDIEYLYNYIKNINSSYYILKSYLYILNKMLIVIVELYFIGM